MKEFLGKKVVLRLADGKTVFGTFLRFDVAFVYLEFYSGENAAIAVQNISSIKEDFKWQEYSNR